MRSSFVRKATYLAVVATLGFGFGFGVPAQAQEASFQEVTGDTEAVLYGQLRKTVILLLSGDSVADVQKRAGRTLSEGERDAIKIARAFDHAIAKREIERRGGDVLATLYGALNGIKVSIPQSRLRELESIPGVVGVKAVGTYERMNATSVPLIGSPSVWQLPGHLQGQGVKIAVIDTGIDYTHANFGGPGTVAAYNAAKATNTAPADPSLFGPAAPKVKGGTDLVGDAYTGSNTPVPDPNPLDCEFTTGSVGHGSHVSGTATGFGVKADGTTFAGPYDSTIYTPGAFRIGPGVAPKADLYSVRVFGCSGNTNVVSEAIDWAVSHGMDVISMSLGSNWGVSGVGGDTAEQTAVANAAAAGIVVVAASGNAGPVPYITSAPAVYPGAISVAATDALSGLPIANLALTGGSNITVQNSNGATYTSPSTYAIRVLRNPDGTVSLGCDPNEYDPAVTGVSLAGTMVVTKRGTCARVYRAGAAQHFGAAAAAMIDTSASAYPPYEGPIPGGAPDPGSGNVYEPVTIPFFGVLSADATALTGPTGGPAPANATATNAGILPNPGFEKIASFSSMGPRIGDDFLKPGITAPGVSTVSTASGTGNGFEILSGTSMATPHVAGVAALVKQANPTWSVGDLRAAIVQTSSPTQLGDYLPRNEGAGLVQPLAAVRTEAVVRNADEGLSFGFADLLTDFSATKTVTVHNNGTKVIQFNLAVIKISGPAAGVTVSTPPSVIVNPNSDATFPVTLSMQASAGTGGTTFQDVSGYIKLTPSNSRLNGGVALTVPYYLVSHGRSNVAGSISGASAAGGTLNFTNVGSALATTTPALWTWGLSQPAPQGIAQMDLRSVGITVSGSNVFFGFNTHNRISTALAFQEIDICIDTSGGPGFTPNKVLIGINGSALSSSASVANLWTTALFNTNATCSTTTGGRLLFTVNNGTDTSVIQMPVPSGGSAATNTGLGLTSAQPRFKYQVRYFGTDGSGAAMPGTGAFNVVAPAQTFTNTGAVAANGTRAVTITRNAAEAALTPSLGVMATAADNVSGSSQGLLFTFP